MSDRTSGRTGKKNIFLTFFLALLAALILSCGLSLALSAWGLTVSHYNVSSLKLTHSFRVVSLADVHGTVFGRENRRLIRLVKAEEPDLIVIPGDLINKYDEDTSDEEALIRALSEIAPVYVAPGNHEREYDSEHGLWGESGVLARFRAAGAVVLDQSFIDLEIRGGETLAVIGATGSGKTTLVSLIPRFYDPSGGIVEVDGIDVREYPLKELRDRVSVCLQKSELFSTTIRDNILLGKRDASEEELRAAAKAAQADDFILQQKDGYDTEVAEGGMSLSGGQRQRIAISRALLKKAEILIFDDSTSALDLKTEAQLYEALRKDYADVTKIIIAQRIASVRNADRIVVLDNGTISACGTHEELMRISPVYRDICESQLKQNEGEGEKTVPGNADGRAERTQEGGRA